MINCENYVHFKIVGDHDEGDQLLDNVREFLFILFFYFFSFL